MKNKKIDILKIKSTSGTKWNKLPWYFKVLIIILIIALLFIPILTLPNFN